MMTQRITTLLVALALITLATTAQNAQKSTSNGKKSTIQLTQQYINFLKKKAQGKQQIAQKRSSDPATVTREQKVKEAEGTQETDVDESFDDFMGDLNANFDDFNQSMQQDFENFRNQINEAYANFMREAWKQFDADAPIPQPKEKDVPPVIKPQEDKPQPRPQEDRVLPIKPVVVTIPKAEPQPEPIEPIEEQPKGDATQHVDFTVFGTQCRIRFGDEERFRLPIVNKDAIADLWIKLATPAYNNTLHDCLQLRRDHQFSDWAYLHLLDSASQACLGKSNEATLLMAYLYCQSGYKMRMGIADNRLFMLFGSKHVLFNRSYYTIGGNYYYPYGGDAEKLYICEVPFPQEQPLSMLLPKEQLFDYEASAPRSLKSAAFPKVLVEATVNKKALSFYASYPPSMINENQQTLWAMYANMPMPKAISQTFMAAMKEKIAGLSQLEAMERLLNFVQTAFVYEYDDKVWGYDRAFFPEETLYYPYCDCEDRSILLSRMVRDLLGVRCVLIHYPGHLAMAVQFTDDVKGDCIMLQGEKFTVCDPTYIGAHVGETMPGMNNAEAKAILLESK